ncbi:chemotaxis protein CheW [Thiomonas sp.]|uniref:Putative Chemotaxis signal transduction CheW-like protein n=1 Tax=mine drainage metagenome TaxID=410659 RepID=E6PMC0_9ZZZZ
MNPAPASLHVGSHLPQGVQARDAEPAVAQGSGSWLLFEADGQLCAIDSRQVRQILLPSGFSPLPGHNPHCPGLLAWQGRVLVVLDLGFSLGRRASLGRPQTRLLVCQGPTHAWAVAVDAVRGFHRDSALAPEWIPVSPGLSPPWNAMFALLPLASAPDGEVCALLHVPALWHGCLAVMSEFSAAADARLHVFPEFET